MNKILLDIIWILHIFIVMFVIVTPFYGDNYLLLLHSICVPFLVLHWVMNENTCALTVIEHKIREQIFGKNSDVIYENNFMARLIEPVYDFRKNNKHLTYILYFSATFLWLISVYRLYTNWKKTNLKSFFQFITR